MANTEVWVRETRIVFEEGLTQFYILLEAYPDAPIGINGWHHKTFPSSKSVIEILTEIGEGVENHLLWPLNGPKGYGE